ncbi:dihydroneopterin aldolase [Candidatus Parcubacteria bacterium]|nr:MAG: dihydroneopterin aldolase [Candidatus Parcubacteria bacterium]
MDKVFIENLTLRGIHGVYEFEWQEPQEFIFDIIAEADLSKSAKTDDLNDTVDWQGMYKIAKDVIEGPRISLIEKIAETVATRILAENEKIQSITIKLRKSEILDEGIPGVMITRTR